MWGKGEATERAGELTLSRELKEPMLPFKEAAELRKEPWRGDLLMPKNPCARRLQRYQRWQMQGLMQVDLDAILEVAPRRQDPHHREYPTKLQSTRPRRCRAHTRRLRPTPRQRRAIARAFFRRDGLGLGTQIR